MNRVVVTGLGIVSSIGNNVKEVLNSLWNGKSGIVYIPEMQEIGFKCCLYGSVKQLNTGGIRKNALQTMSDVAKYATVATIEALADANLSLKDIQNNRTGIIVGTAYSGTNEATKVEKIIEREMPLSQACGTGIVKIMNHSTAGNLAAYFGVKGRVYSLSTACATGLDNLGHAYEMLQHGMLDVCISGAAEEDSWKQIGALFDNGNESPRSWNDRPSQASRPYDRDREGFVLASGGGIIVMETFEHAQRRGARILAEIIGYGASNDGADMFKPSGEGLKRSIKQAMKSASERNVTSIDFINPHGTGTHIGDMVEARVIKELFGETSFVSATKSLTGHALGGAGAVEAVLTLLMLSGNFVSATANLDNVAPECTGIRHARSLHEKSLKTAMANNSGLGGTNTCMVFKKPEE